uniref:Uncharacterized protein n=1 Tax=Romanomermis culicivorax TaxID=13658 RepID=A0A915KUL1_ROMCU
MTTPSTSSASAADEPPPYRESINVNKCYVRWAEQQPDQNDLSSACEGTVPNGFHSLKVLRRTIHPKLLTALKVPKKKKKKQKDERNKSLDVSDNEDLALQPQSIFDDLERLQAAITSAMKSNLLDRLIELLNFPVSPMYKFAIRDRLQ